MSGIPPLAIGFDPAGTDKTSMTMYVPHAHHPGCGLTVVRGDQLRLYALGLLPLRCKSCGELMTDREGA
jgi:hypothetical protein